VEPWNRLPDTLKKAANKQNRLYKDQNWLSEKVDMNEKLKVTTASEEWTLF
jgi:hypothetical protein